jgi:hypothetical protein
MKGADPDDQDIFGNTVLHMVVVTGQLVICMRLFIHEGSRIESQGLKVQQNGNFVGSEF